MTETVNIFSGSNGLNTRTDPARLSFDPDTGVQDLAVAYNVDHDRTGRISRRKGYSATARTEDIHSLFCDGGACVFVTGTSLCQLHADYSYSVVATVTSGARVGYLQLHNRVYWANGFEKGYIENSVNHSWVAGTYYGPVTTRQYSDPPIGTRLAWFGGSIFVIQGNAAWYSNLFDLNAFDLSRNFYQFQTSIRMWRPIADGIYVSTERNTYFLPGAVSNDLGRMQVADYPAVEWTDANVPLEKIGSGEVKGIGAIWTSTEGICVGLPQGQMLNLSLKKIKYPNSRRGAGIVIDDRYIGLLEP
jgi:hypothetical protein